MALIALLESNLLAFILLAGLVGLMVGSFLNVVIHRLPIMLNNRWRLECQEFIAEGDNEQVASVEPFNLLIPGSRCPHCGHKIRAIENIPVLSYLWLAGKCVACKQKISVRYPIVEILSGVLTAVLAGYFGFSSAAALMMLLTWALIALTFIDLDHQILPDVITLPFLWLGLLVNLSGTFASLQEAVIGAVAGYLSLWSIYQLFKLITGKEGMGYGDFKLFALFGAWFGWKILPLIILVASCAGAIVGITAILLRGRDRNLPIPFGPFLCAAGWISALWGETLITLYIQIAGIAN